MNYINLNSVSFLFSIFTTLTTPPPMFITDNRLCTLVIMCLGVLWLPVIQSYGSGGIMYYVQSVLAYLSPPVFAVFSTSVLWSRINEQVTLILFFLFFL